MKKHGFARAFFFYMKSTHKSKSAFAGSSQRRFIFRIWLFGVSQAENIIHRDVVITCKSNQKGNRNLPFFALVLRIGVLTDMQKSGNFWAYMHCFYILAIRSPRKYSKGRVPSERTEEEPTVCAAKPESMPYISESMVTVAALGSAAITVQKRMVL